MFIKRFMLACVASAAMVSASAQAAPELAPMPRVVPVAKFDLKKVPATVHGRKLVFSSEFANLQGRELTIETRFCDKEGNYLTFEKEQEIIYSEDVTPDSHSVAREVVVRVSADTIKQLYGSEAPQIYVVRTIRDKNSKVLLATTQIYSFTNKLPPQAPLLPRG